MKVRKFFLVAAGLWTGGSAFVLFDAAFSKDHYKQQVWHRLGQGDSFTIPHLTLFAKPISPQGATAGSMYRAEQDITIDGQRYVLYFRSDDPDLATRASRYVMALPAQDAQEIEATSSTNKRVVVPTLLKWAIIIPLAMVALWAVIAQVSRVFRLKTEQHE